MRARTGALGFVRTKMDTKAADLSGGEKARLLLGLATFTGANLMILDEPTNHLDIDSREALVQALGDYPGAVILISHDRHLIEASVDRLWLVAGGTVAPYDGDLDDYRRDVLDSRTAARQWQRRRPQGTGKCDGAGPPTRGCRAAPADRAPAPKDQGCRIVDRISSERDSSP